MFGFKCVSNSDTLQTWAHHFGLPSCKAWAKPPALGWSWGCSTQARSGLMCPNEWCFALAGPKPTRLPPGAMCALPGEISPADPYLLLMLRFQIKVAL